MSIPKDDELVRAMYSRELTNATLELEGIRTAEIETAARKRFILERIEWLKTKAGDFKWEVVERASGSRKDSDSLRGHIRSILNVFPSGAKPREVLKVLQQNGFKFNGKTDPATRISSELWRMAKIKDIEARDGRYFPGAKGG